MIFGHVERITYFNEENGFTVAKLQEKGKKELTTVTGYARLTPGESVKLQGKWANHKKYGNQFNFEICETTVPATVKAIEQYLSSGIIKGIGPVMAKRIVAKFKEDTFDIIENHPERLSEVNGIAHTRTGFIKEAWNEQKEIKEIMFFLQNYGVNPSRAEKIYKEYGNDSIEVIKTNPYQLARDIDGIGFITADKIAQNIGIPPNSPLRVKEGVIYCLNKSTDDGHLYLPVNELTIQSAGILKVDKTLISTAINELHDPDNRIVIEDEKVYLKPLYIIESRLAEKLSLLHSSKSSIKKIDTAKAVEWVGNILNIKFADQQKEAISSAVQDKITIITGGPGTGKTTIIKAILTILNKLQAKTLLAAPTGRAAKRMNEATNFTAKTIHRLLKYKPDTKGFTYNEKNPLDVDVLIIDETSMIDVKLMYDLIKAVPLHAHLILVGDTDQLPSVGPGNVLKDIIESKRFKTITLTEIFRQAQSSKIITSAHRINKGTLPDLKNETKSDFYFIEKDNPEDIVSTIIDLCKNRIPKAFGLDPIKDIQVLSPMHKGTTGVENLNAELQKALNPYGKEFTRGSRAYRIGDKVMQVKNNYTKDVFNGDIGTIRAIDFEEQEIKIAFDNRLITYEFSEMEEVVLSYAASIHKAQGSEYPAVVIPVTTQHYIMLQKNLIYTGVTRGKKLVVLIGTKKALAIAVKNNKQQARFTLLSERLEEVLSG